MAVSRQACTTGLDPSWTINVNNLKVRKMTDKPDDTWALDESDDQADKKSEHEPVRHCILATDVLWLEGLAKQIAEPVAAWSIDQAEYFGRLIDTSVLNALEILRFIQWVKAGQPYTYDKFNPEGEEDGE